MARVKQIAALAVLLCAAAGPAFAQSALVGSWKSPRNPGDLGWNVSSEQIGFRANGTYSRFVGLSHWAVSDVGTYQVSEGAIELHVYGKRDYIIRFRYELPDSFHLTLTGWGGVPYTLERQETRLAGSWHSHKEQESAFFEFRADGTYGRSFRDAHGGFRESGRYEAAGGAIDLRVGGSHQVVHLRYQMPDANYLVLTDAAGRNFDLVRETAAPALPPALPPGLTAIKPLRPGGIVGKWGTAGEGPPWMGIEFRPDGTYSRDLHDGRRVFQDSGTYQVVGGAIDLHVDKSHQVVRFQHEMTATNHLILIDAAGTAFDLVSPGASRHIQVFY